MITSTLCTKHQSTGSLVTSITPVYTFHNHCSSGTGPNPLCSVFPDHTVIDSGVLTKRDVLAALNGRDLVEFSIGVDQSFASLNLTPGGRELLTAKQIREESLDVRVLVMDVLLDNTEVKGYIS